MEMQCGHCGSHLPLAASPSQAAIFARIKASDTYAQRNSPERIAQLPKVGELQKVILHVFFVVFICGSGFMAVMMLGMAGVFGLFGIRSAGGLGAAFSLAPLCMAGVPVGFVILGVFILRHQRKKMHSLENDPVDATPVVIVDKRTEVTGGGNSSARTSYFVTCETEEGGRQEYQVWDGNLYGRLAADDAGILFMRAGYGLDFDRVIPQLHE